MIKANLIKHTRLSDTDDVSMRTFQLVYPLFIHAELMSHRAFSRNCASARAIPTARMIELAKEHSTAPVQFRLNQAGMRPAEACSSNVNNQAHKVWDQAMHSACEYAEMLGAGAGDGLNVHKQWVNRLLMPFTHMSTILSTTELDNFYHLRCNTELASDSDAQEEIFMLASSMKQLDTETDAVVSPYHIPFYPDIDPLITTQYELIKILIDSVAKISRESYMRTDADKTFSENCEQIIRLFNNGRTHWSPFEHIAFDRDCPLIRNLSCTAGSGNLDNRFVQLRHIPELLNKMRALADIELLCG